MTPKRSVIGEVPWALVGIVIIVLYWVYNTLGGTSRTQDLFLKQLTWLGINWDLQPHLQFRTIEPLSQSLTSFMAVLALLVAVLVQGYSAGGARRWLWEVAFSHPSWPLRRFSAC